MYLYSMEISFFYKESDKFTYVCFRGSDPKVIFYPV